MSATDSSTPAEAARLLPELDAERLLADLMTARDHLWDEQSAHANGRVIKWDEQQDWRCLPIRSPGGDKTRTDAGGAGSAEFADTEWLDHMPYVREILRSIPGPLHAARFLDLGPGVVGYPHTDAKFAPDWGLVRLHAPVTTHEAAILDLDGAIHRWQPGEFWFGDFSRRHHIQNLGPEHRVHLVVDVLVTAELARLFPADWAGYFDGPEVLCNRPVVTTTAPEREAARCSFDAPAHLLETEAFGSLTGPQPESSFSIVDTGTELAVRSPENHLFPLAGLGGNEYRLVGWSEERTVTTKLDGPRPEVELTYRKGRRSTRLSVPATPAA
ncbi:aspartyl/asparaginyl beta-hydroxylase domain-containing protein [Amycolatopsis sp. PS_44_ISF1]|uniref:aspartyl/asparaginyl beta-hydroxylase domain-containing protein n=1 Tax=Amycolatopsis sp. PS_44_ISF1 TaxID=2974917 RepID=UPI0028E04472|nr:aspartyl/asparaginyl beta-hydroxylase domain-containing protein [Amycolatopsis sp. PS_44_ISF1]MDT8912002.1 aspartyl/asparaginyl beta-hydroxylase domain-containing protein [Amycolatopsis sp. PS_44_ISF1]